MKKKKVAEICRKEKRKGTLCQACVWFDRYEIKEILGEGGSGRVYLARDIRLGRPVAIKILEQVTEQFKEEVAVLRRQNYLMLPTVYDAWTEEKRTGVIVMEYVEGCTLKEYLSLHRQVPEKQIYEWGLQLGAFLRDLHSRNPKILYRDLKTENIMVQDDKTLRLVDVGAAVHVEAGKVYRNKRVGTYGFAAPEQWMGEASDERADIYGLGAVLYAMVEGEEKLKSLVTADHVLEKSRGSAGMMRVIKRCMSREKNKRYATAEAFLADWKRYKSFGRGRGAVLRAGVILQYGFLYAAVYIIWYRNEFLPVIRSFLAGYLWLKAAEWIFQKQGEKWEQKKSVWCRGCEYDKISTDAIPAPDKASVHREACMPEKYRMI